MLVLAYFLRIYKRTNALLIWKKTKQTVILKYLQVYVHNKKYLYTYIVKNSKVKFYLVYS